MNANMKHFFTMQALYGDEDTRQPSVKTIKGFSPRKPKPQPKYGSTCTNCGLKRSVTGSCFCD